MKKEYIYSALIAAVVASLVLFVGGLVGNQSADTFGASGLNRYPNSGIAAKFLKLTSSPGTVTAGNDGTFSATGAVTLSGGDVRIVNPEFTGTVTSLGAAATTTVTSANICDSAVLTRASGTVSATTTLPTAAAMFADCLTTDGDTIRLIFRNLGVAAASTTIITANTSTTLVGDTSGDDIIDGLNEAELTFVRASATELLVVIQEYVAAD